MNYSDHNTTHISACLVVFLAIVCSPLQCFSGSKVLDHSINLGGAVEDADISPNGEYMAAAVRKCGMLGGSRTRKSKVLLHISGYPNLSDLACCCPGNCPVGLLCRDLAEGIPGREFVLSRAEESRAKYCATE